MKCRILGSLVNMCDKNATACSEEGKEKNQALLTPLETRTEMELRYRLLCLKMLIDGNLAHFRVLDRLFSNCVAAGFWLCPQLKNFPQLNFVDKFNFTV